MPRNQDSSKVLHIKPNLQVEALEDRSLPGNTVLGLTGIENPLQLLNTNVKQLSVAPSAATKAATSKTSQNITNIRSVPPASAGVSQVLSRLGATTVANQLNSSSNQFNGAASSDIGSAATTTTPTVNNNSFDTLLSSASSKSTSANSPVVQVTDSTQQNAKTLEGFLGQISGKSPAVKNNGSTTTVGISNSLTDTQANDDGDAGNYDIRALIASANPKTLTPAMQQAANLLLNSVKGLNYTVRADAGTPNQIMNTGGYLTGTSSLQPQQVVTNFLKQNKTFLGLQDSDINSLTVNYQYKWNNTGPTMMYLVQKVNGITLSGGMTTASIMPTGQLVSLANNMTPNLAASVNTANPTLTAQQAVAMAAQDSARYLGISLNYGNLVQTANEGGAERAVTFTNSILSNDAIPVRLNYLTVQPGDVRLVWNLRVYIPNSTYLFDYNIDAKTGEVLTRQNWISADSYRVFATPVRNPDNGGRTLVTNPADPIASPYGWHDTNGKAGAEYTVTRGNNTLTREARNGDPSAGFIGGNYAVGVNGNNYDFALNLKNDPATYIPAATTNLFYWVNSIHDTLYNLGFNEPAGNFQQNNYGKGGLQNDPIYAYTQAGANLGQSDNAFFVPSLDGTPGRLAMFIAFAPPGGTRDLDFENDTIGHEYFHGVSNRLVGGPNAFGLSGFQGSGLGEGWSDVNALFMTTKITDTKNTPRPFGGYTGGPNQNFGGGPVNTAEPNGFRNYPYSYDMTVDPETFADVDYSQAAHYKANGPSTGSFYQIGEVWATTVNDMYWNLVNKYGFSSDLAHGTGGNNLAMKLVLAGLAMTSSAPTILAARNGILAADMALTGGANQLEIWSAFARRGMGTNARDGVAGNAVAPDGRTLPCVVGVVESFDIPAGLIDTNPTPPTPVGGNGSNDSLYEPNETSNAAFNLGTLTGLNTLTNLQIKTPVAGRVQDRDWFKFTPSKAGTLTITAEVSSSAGDLDLRVYRAASSSPTAALTEVSVGQGTHRTTGTSEVVNLAVGAGITYYFNVQGYNSGSGNYNLIINAPS